MKLKPSEPKTITVRDVFVGQRVKFNGSYEYHLDFPDEQMIVGIKHNYTGDGRTTLSLASKSEINLQQPPVDDVDFEEVILLESAR